MTEGQKEIKKDCYLCAYAPKIELGKPYCHRLMENIEPTYTGDGPVLGWSCADVAKNCGSFKPKQLFFDEEAQQFYEIKKGQRLYYT